MILIESGFDSNPYSDLTESFWAEFINRKLYFIVSNDDENYKFLYELDPEHVELKHYDTYFECHRVTTGWFYTSLECIDYNFKDIVWLCPD